MMDKQTMLLAGGAVALIGIAYLMTAGGSEDTGGTSGGGGLLMPGQGVSMSPAPAPVSDGGAAPVTYNLSLPDNPTVPAMMAVPAPYIPPIPAGYDTSGGGAYATKKDTVVSGVPVNAPGGKTTYAYGVSGVAEAKAAQSADIRAGSPNVNVGREIAPGVTMVADSKKDSNVAAAASVGIGAGLASSPLGGLVSAIGGLFGW